MIGDECWPCCEDGFLRETGMLSAREANGS